MTEGWNVLELAESRWDLVALGEVMLRLDPGERRIATARSFDVWEGGGEYNVARSLRRCFDYRTTVVTALADNPVGRLIEDLMLQGGVDTSHVDWVPYDGIGRRARNGINFTERGFGVRAAYGCSDRGHAAASQLTAESVDWESLLRAEPTRWLHTGGIFAGLSSTTPDAAKAAMEAARAAGAVVSYDLNFRPSLWQGLDGRQRAIAVNRELVAHTDVLFGNEDAFRDALGIEVEGESRLLSKFDPQRYVQVIVELQRLFPQLKLIAVSLREVHSATVNDWGGLAWTSDAMHSTPSLTGLQIVDRVGGGDAFASGVIDGLLDGCSVTRALALGVAHGALTMTTPGDGSMATRTEVEALADGSTMSIVR